MPGRAMVVVGGGSGSRFGGEKLLEMVAGLPLVAHTIDAVSARVDRCVLVTRDDLVADVEALRLDTEVVPGGATRTLSEMAGLAALGDGYELIGIHDAARPLVSGDLIDVLYLRAGEVGGSAPVMPPDTMLVDRRYLKAVDHAVTAQTPQVFRGPDLMAAYVRAAQAGFEGHDTVEVIMRFGDLDIAAVPGESRNVKVTFPSDLETVRRLVGDPARNELR